MRAEDSPPVSDLLTTPQATPTPLPPDGLLVGEAPDPFDADVPPPTSPLRVVAIGASAGGLAALERFFDSLPPNPGAAFVVIQHLSPDYPSHMQELLARHTDMPVQHAQQGEALQANRCYLISPGKLLTQTDSHFVVEARGDVALHQPIDHFFRSLSVFGSRAAAVILTGTGSDGSRGVQAIVKSGGAVFIQDPEKSEFPGMPSSALEAVRADLIGDPSALALGVYWWARHQTGTDVSPQPSHITSYHQILAHLKDTFGIEFELYKQGTILRRLDRRLSKHGISTLEQYLTLLTSDRTESQALLNDLLIGVTAFFRDKRVFEHLRAEILPSLVRRAAEQPEIRLWVAGCATGEEAYSLAMLLHEAATTQHYSGRLRVFATDVHRGALELAGAGTYSLEQFESIPPDLAARYVMRTAGSTARITATIKKIVVFAPHNLLTDPGFTRIDLISCRNLLIYLDIKAQEQALTTLYNALNQEGLLLLGSSEGLGMLHGEFVVVDARLKIFRKTGAGRIPAPPSSMHLPKEAPPQWTARRPISRPEPISLDTRLLGIYDVILSQCRLSGLLLDEQARLLHVFGEASRLLAIREGRQPESAVKLLPTDLQAAAQSVVERAIFAKQVSRLDAVESAPDGRTIPWILTATPMTNRHQGTHVLLSVQPADHAALPEPRNPPLPDTIEHDYRDRVIELEREVIATRENLQATVEALQTTNEELQSSNEELQSANEELQSANQELQSVNEELHTVNSEYDQKNRLLADLIRDHDNLLNNTDVGIIYLDNQCRIRRFNSSATRLFRLIPHDVGRHLGDITSDIPKIDELHQSLRHLLSDGQEHERTVELPNGTCYLLRLTPYRTEGRTVEGALITVTDMTQCRQLEDRLRHGQRLESIGRLAGGIAHDFNNLLCGIQGYAKILEQRATDEYQVKALRSIQDATNRAASLTANLLAFGRKAKLESAPVDLHTIVHAAVNLATTSLHDGIRVRISLDAPHSIVVGDAAQLQAMVLNLLINAKDAMPRGGAISISSTVVQVEAHTGATLRPAIREGTYLLLEIADQGGGIAGEYLDHLFEPFFTTKGPSGNGLGLAAVYGTVSEHGGGILLRTGDEGSRFGIHLPLSPEPIPASPATAPEKASQRGTGAILVVDDEPALREMLTHFLEDVGYTVTVAENASRAIALYQQHGPFDLVLLDVTMPGMNGLEAFHVLRELDQDARILLLSGHTFGQIDQELYQQGLCGFLKKPFDLVELSALIAQHIRQTA